MGYDEEKSEIKEEIMKTIEFGALIVRVSGDGGVSMVKCFSSDYTAAPERVEKLPVCRVEIAGEKE